MWLVLFQGKALSLWLREVSEGVIGKVNSQTRKLQTESRI